MRSKSCNNNATVTCVKDILFAQFNDLELWFVGLVAVNCFSFTVLLCMRCCTAVHFLDLVSEQGYGRDPNGCAFGWFCHQIPFRFIAPSLVRFIYEYILVYIRVNICMHQEIPGFRRRYFGRARALTNTCGRLAAPGRQQQKLLGDVAGKVSQEKSFYCRVYFTLSRKFDTIQHILRKKMYAYSCKLISSFQTWGRWW